MNTEPLIQKINIESIIPNRFQPRLTFDEKALNELAASIKEHGIIQPLVLRRIGDKFEIIAGERRYKAATIAGLTEVPAIISNMDDNKSAEIALVENVQRKNLNSLEEAKSYKKILDKEYMTQEELAKKMGISQSSIANKLRLLNLPEEVQEALMNDKISERHARSLLQLSDSEAQLNLLHKIIKDRLTVRQVDDEIKNINSQDVSKEETPTDVNITEEKENAKEIPTNNAIPFLNIFNNPTEQYSSLEDEQTNLNTEQIDSLDDDSSVSLNNSDEQDNIFDNQNNTDVENVTNIESSSSVLPVAKEEEEKIEKPDINENNDKMIIEANNLDSVKKAYANLATEIQKAGYKISFEDFDFEDLYQLIVKIDKQG